MRRVLADLLRRDSLVANYVEPDALPEVLAAGDTAWISKLATVEILLRLLRDRWR